MKHPAAPGMLTILFGAFDRHNFGDLLFPHIAAALLNDGKLIFAGLAERDMRCHGGHPVRALARLAAELDGQPVNLIHAGGELLTCDAWQAAVMLLPPHQAKQVIARLEARREERTEWARAMLGIAAQAPYTASRELFPGANRVIYNAVGGVDLNDQSTELRAEVLVKLRAADDVSVRDRRTLAQLEAAGIPARLVPDPAVMVAELFDAQIRHHAQQGEAAGIINAFPQGYIAVQFSADFGDDETLDEMAAQLDQAAAASGHALVLFRAGAAPWHDDLECYQRIVQRMRAASTRIFSSLNLWDICALIAHSRAYCGSSLHGWIVAAAFGLPGVNLRHPAQTGRLTKQEAYCSTWEAPASPAIVDVPGIVQGIDRALMADKGELRLVAGELAARYRRHFASLRGLLK